MSFRFYDMILNFTKEAVSQETKEFQVSIPELFHLSTIFIWWWKMKSWKIAQWETKVLSRKFKRSQWELNSFNRKNKGLSQSIPWTKSLKIVCHMQIQSSIKTSRIQIMVIMQQLLQLQNMPTRIKRHLKFIIILEYLWKQSLREALKINYSFQDSKTLMKKNQKLLPNAKSATLVTTLKLKLITLGLP